MVNMESEFVSLVSHELRTPLTSIKGYVDYLLEKPGRFGTEDTECLQIVQKNARRLMELVNDLLDVSRLEEGKVQLQRTVFDLEELVQEVVQSLQPQLLAKAHQLTIQSLPTRPFVLADRQRITQVLTNLLSNACKYTLAAGRITLILKPEGEQLWVAVRDNGIGMTADEQAKLFTKFYRANNETVQDAGGTGLGLVIAHMLVQLHGGALQVESAPGEGSTFSMMLPLAQEQGRRESNCGMEGSR